MDTQKIIAIFIDAENISHQHADFVMNIAKKYGNPLIRRIYANWSNSSVHGWKDATHQYAMQAFHQFSLVKGKNTVDILLVADVMETVLMQQIDAVVLVTSDSDFTALAIKLRTLGKTVIGIGNNNANNGLMSACEHFYPLPTIKPAHDILPEIKSTQITINPVIKTNDKPNPNDDEALLAFITKIFDEHSKDKIELSLLGTHLKNSPNFSHKKYQYKTLSQLIKALNDFEIIEINKTTFIQKRQAKIMGNTNTPTQIVHKSINELRDDAKLNNAIANAIATHKRQHGWAMVGEISNHVAQNFGIHAQQYGHRTLSQILALLPNFQMVHHQKGDWVCDTRIDDPSNPPSDACNKSNDDKNINQGIKKGNEPEQDALSPLHQHDVAHSSKTAVTPPAQAQTALADDELFPDGDKLDLTHLLMLIKQAIKTHQNSDGLTKIGDIGQFIRQKTGYGSQSFGYRHFGELLAKLPDFQLIRQEKQLYAKYLA